MSVSEEDIQQLVGKIETSQAKARKRTWIAVVVPTVSAVLYLGFMTMLIVSAQQKLDNTQEQLEIVEQKKTQKTEELKTTTEELKTTTEELKTAEEQLAVTKQRLEATLNSVAQTQAADSSGEEELAREILFSISTDFTENETNGFRAILSGDLESARRLFGAAYAAYPTYHNVYEIYTQVLTPELIESYNSADGEERQAILKAVMREIVEKHRWGMPEALLNEMQGRLSS